MLSMVDVTGRLPLTTERTALQAQMYVMEHL